MALNLKQFSKWAQSHQRRALKQGGVNISPEQYAGLGRNRRKQVIAKVQGGLPAPTPHTSPGAPGKPGKPKPPKPPKDPYAAQLGADTRLKYGAADAALASQARISDASAARLPSFFSEYQRRVQELTAGQQAGYQAAQAQLANITNASSAQAAQNQAQVDQRAQQDAAVRGATVDPNLAQQAASSQASVRGNLDTFGGLLASQGANANSYMLDKQRIGSGEQINQILAERGRRNVIAGKAADLQSEKGAFKVADRAALSSAAHKAQLEDVAFNLNVNKEKNAQTDKKFQRRLDLLKARNDRLKLKSDLADAKTGRAKDEAATAIDEYNLAHPHHPVGKGNKPAKGPKSSTPTERRNNHRQWGSFVSLAEAVRKGTAPTDPLTGKPTGIPQPGDANYELYVVAKHYTGNKRKFLPGDIKRLKKNWPGVL